MKTNRQLSKVYLKMFLGVVLVSLLLSLLRLPFFVPVLFLYIAGIFSLIQAIGLFLSKDAHQVKYSWFYVPFIFISIGLLGVSSDAWFFRSMLERACIPSEMFCGIGYFFTEFFIVLPLSLLLIISGLFLLRRSQKEKVNNGSLLNKKIPVFTYLFVTLASLLVVTGLIAWTKIQLDRSVQSSRRVTKEMIKIDQEKYEQEEKEATEFNQKRDVLLRDLYEKLNKELEGVHKVQYYNESLLHITLDTGHTYWLNTDSDAMRVYEDIVKNKNNHKSYYFSLGSYESFFRDYYARYSLEDLENIKNNFNTYIFVIPMPAFVE